MQVLQASFEMDQNPDGQELEHISQIIGRTVFVVTDPCRADTLRTEQTSDSSLVSKHPSTTEKGRSWKCFLSRYLYFRRQQKFSTRTRLLSGSSDSSASDNGKKRTLQSLSALYLR